MHTKAKSKIFCKSYLREFWGKEIRVTVMLKSPLTWYRETSEGRNSSWMHLYFMLIILQYIWEGKITWLISLTSAAALLSKMQRTRRPVREGSFHHVLLLVLLAQRPEGVWGGHQWIYLLLCSWVVSHSMGALNMCCIHRAPLKSMG